MTTAVTRPIGRYHGAKWRLAPWILGLFPPHIDYVEPFGGAAGVLLQKPRALGIEVYNDVDGAIVNVFRVLRDPARADALRQLLELTPYSREEFELAYEDPTPDPVENARRTIFRLGCAFGGTGTSRYHTGFRMEKSGLVGWSTYPRHVQSFCDRLRGCVVENHLASEIIAQNDSPSTLFYLDPPYPFSTRNRVADGGRRYDYSQEMSDDDHRQLAEQIHRIDGMVVLSGYPCDLYDCELYPTWERHITRARVNNSKGWATEVAWLNGAAASARRAANLSLAL